MASLGAFSMSSLIINTKRILGELDSKFIWIAGLIGVFGILFVKHVGVGAPIVAVLLIVILLLSWRQPEISLYFLLAYLPFAYVLGAGFSAKASFFNLSNTLPVVVLGLAVRSQWAHGKPLFERTGMTAAILLFAGISSMLFVRMGWVQGAGYLGEKWSDFKGAMLPLGGYFLAMWLVGLSPRAFRPGEAK